jgi:nucleoside-diphosphate-sugar epimerase
MDLMRVLVTGHDGYIGSVLVPLFMQAGHEVAGLDSYLYAGCALGQDENGRVPAIRKDIRDAKIEDLEGFDAATTGPKRLTTSTTPPQCAWPRWPSAPA